MTKEALKLRAENNLAALAPADAAMVKAITCSSVEETRSYCRMLAEEPSARNQRILEVALDYEKTHSPRITALTMINSALKKATPPAKLPIEALADKVTAERAADPEVTTEQPKRPEWEAVRETVAQITFHGRMFVRGQVKLGMLLAGLKKAQGIARGGDHKSNGRICPLIPWDKLVTEETGFSRRSGDEFIRLYDAAKAKLKKSKTLKLPAGLAKDAIVLFQSENALALTDEQWIKVDELIGTLTTGETQASLLAELGIVPKPAAMPKPKGGKDEEEEPTAGQLAFHFFEAMASPLINARTSPDYLKLLHALPLTSTEEHPLSLATLEAEARAMLADIENVKQATAKPARGKVIEA